MTKRHCSALSVLIFRFFSELQKSSLILLRVSVKIPQQQQQQRARNRQQIYQTAEIFTQVIIQLKKVLLDYIRREKKSFV